MLSDVDGYGGNNTITLDEIKSNTKKPETSKELGDGSRFDAWLFRTALRLLTADGRAQIKAPPCDRD